MHQKSNRFLPVEFHSEQAHLGARRRLAILSKFVRRQLRLTTSASTERASRRARRLRSGRATPAASPVGHEVLLCLSAKSWGHSECPYEFTCGILFTNAPRSSKRTSPLWNSTPTKNIYYRKSYVQSKMQPSSRDQVCTQIIRGYIKGPAAESCRENLELGPRKQFKSGNKIQRHLGFERGPT